MRAYAEETNRLNREHRANGEGRRAELIKIEKAVRARLCTRRCSRSSATPTKGGQSGRSLAWSSRRPSMTPVASGIRRLSRRTPGQHLGVYQSGEIDRPVQFSANHGTRRYATVSGEPLPLRFH